MDCIPWRWTRAGLLLLFLLPAAASPQPISLFDWQCDPLAPGVYGAERCDGRLLANRLVIRGLCDRRDPGCSANVLEVLQSLAGAERGALLISQAGYGPLIRARTDFWTSWMIDEVGFEYTARSIRLAGIFAAHCGQGAWVEPTATLSRGEVYVGRDTTRCDIVLDRSNPNPWPVGAEVKCTVTPSDPMALGARTRMAGEDRELAIIEVRSAGVPLTGSLVYGCGAVRPRSAAP